MSKNNEKRTPAELEAGLKPVVPMTHTGNMYVDTTQALAEKACVAISNTLNIPELDNILFIPKLANNSVGISEMITQAYFSVGQGGNIFYRGKNNRNDGGGVLAAVGLGSGTGTGPFGVSDGFRKAFASLCPVNNNGKILMNIKAHPRYKGLAVLELDTNSVLCFALGIEPSDPDYDFDIIGVSPLGGENSRNYSISIMKFITGTNNRRGKNKKINYAAIEQEQFRRFNNGGKNNRNY